MFSSLLYYVCRSILVALFLLFIASPQLQAADAPRSQGLVLKTSEPDEVSSGSGIVLETMDAADYTYIQVKEGKDTVWVAMPRTKVKKGTQINYALGMVVTDFKSKTLDRVFPQVIFSPGLLGTPTAAPQIVIENNVVGSSSFSEAVKKEAQQNSTSPEEMQDSPGSTGATAPFIEEKIPPATGKNSYTVENIFANAKKLDGQTVRVRGKVVKVNLNIMGKNWIHLQDGTGNPMNNSHDLVVTSATAPELDQVVLIEGKMAANKDFGYGYSYEALVEDAVLVE